MTSIEAELSFHGGGDAEVAALDAPMFVRAMGMVAQVLEDHAGGLDRLDRNDLFEDSDGSDAFGAPGRIGPGTDLAATVGAAAAAVDGQADFATVSTVLADAARGAARTVAGRRIAAVLAGMAEVICNADRVDGLRFALALESGAERLARVDDGRHTGELPAVAAAAADGALGAADDGSNLIEVLVSAADSGLEELEQGPLADGRLAERGGVDATSAGFLLMIDTLASVVSGEPLPVAPTSAPLAPTPAPSGASNPGSASVATAFVVRCVVHPHGGPDIESGDQLAGVLHELADVHELSILGERWTVDVSSRFPGAVVEALAEAGRLTEVHVGLAGS